MLNWRSMHYYISRNIWNIIEWILVVTVKSCGQIQWISLSTAVIKFNGISLSTIHCSKIQWEFPVNSCSQIRWDFPVNSCSQIWWDFPVNSCIQIWWDFPVNSCSQIWWNFPVNSCSQIWWDFPVNSCSQIQWDFPVNSFSQIQWECSQNQTSMGFHWNLALTRQLKEINQVTTAHFTQKLKKQSEIIESHVLSCHNLNHVHPPFSEFGGRRRRLLGGTDDKGQNSGKTYNKLISVINTHLGQSWYMCVALYCKLIYINDCHSCRFST